MLLYLDYDNFVFLYITMLLNHYVTINSLEESLFDTSRIVKVLFIFS